MKKIVIILVIILCFISAYFIFFYNRYERLIDKYLITNQNIKNDIKCFNYIDTYDINEKSIYAIVYEPCYYKYGNNIIRLDDKEYFNASVFNIDNKKVINRNVINEYDDEIKEKLLNIDKNMFDNKARKYFNLDSVLYDGSGLYEIDEIIIKQNDTNETILKFTDDSSSVMYESVDVILKDKYNNSYDFYELYNNIFHVKVNEVRKFVIDNFNIYEEYYDGSIMYYKDNMKVLICNRKGNTDLVFGSEYLQYVEPYCGSY